MVSPLVQVLGGLAVAVGVVVAGAVVAGAVVVGAVWLVPSLPARVAGAVVAGAVVAGAVVAGAVRGRRRWWSERVLDYAPVVDLEAPPPGGCRAIRPRHYDPESCGSPSGSFAVL